MKDCFARYWEKVVLHSIKFSMLFVFLLLSLLPSSVDAITAFVANTRFVNDLISSRVGCSDIIFS